MSEEVPIETLMGWCESLGTPDQWHSLCRYEYRTQFGVLLRCSCPAHMSAVSDTIEETESDPARAVTRRGRGPTDKESNMRNGTQARAQGEDL